MIKPADSRNLDGDGRAGWLDFSGFWRILVESEMATGIMIIGEI
jgi:hypothetical protein